MKLAYIVLPLFLSSNLAFAGKVLLKGDIDMLKLTGTVVRCEDTDIYPNRQSDRMNNAILDAVEALGNSSAQKVSIDNIALSEKQYCFTVNYKQ